MSKKDDTRPQNVPRNMDARGEIQRQAELLKENKMGVMPVEKLLVKISVPLVISMLVQAMYNVVDSIFVGHLGEEALAAVGLVFPVQILMIAVSVGTGTGFSSRLGRRLGEGNVESVNRTAANGLFLMVLGWAVFALLGLFGTRAFLAPFAVGAGSAEIARMGADYMYIVTIGSLGQFMSIATERLLQATGRSMFSMATQLAGALVNIILDPLFIFGIGPFPRMEVAGAALATIIGQFASMAIGFWACLGKNPEISLSFRRFRPNLKTIRHIYQVGLPSIIMQAVGSVMVFAMNKILITFGTTPVSVFSVYFKLQSFIFMPLFGFSNGMISIIAFNFGARKRARITRTLKLCLIINFCTMAAGTLLFIAAPAFMLALFNATPAMLEIGTVALRLISLSFPAAGISIALSGAFQALGRGSYSLIISIARQLLFLLPAAILLANTFGLTAIWWAFPLSEIISIILGVFFYTKLYRQRIKPLDGAAPLPV